MGGGRISWINFNLFTVFGVLLGFQPTTAFPYITYETAIGSLDDLIPLSASIWYKSTSLADLSRKTEEIYNYLAAHNPVLIKIDNGYLWLFKNGIFAQDQASGVDNVKAKYITIYGEFLTN